MVDRYTKAVLTVIAAALKGERSVQLRGKQASSSGQGEDNSCHRHER